MACPVDKPMPALPITGRDKPEAECRLLAGGLNRSTQHSILEGKDGVWDGTEIS